LNDRSFFPERGTDGNHFLMESSLVALEMPPARRPAFTLEAIHERCPPSDVAREWFQQDWNERDESAIVEGSRIKTF
jgi:hypothetical protein